MTIENLKTAGALHLDVPDEQRGHLVAGPFGNGPRDYSNYLAIQANLKSKCGAHCFRTVEELGSAYYVLVNPEEQQAVRLLARLVDVTEDPNTNGIIDETLYAEVEEEAIRDEWRAMPFSCRLIMLADHGIDMADSLKSYPPDETYELLQEIMERC
jgi:hypothetical protein